MPVRVGGYSPTVGAEEFLPDSLDLESLRHASSRCRGCDLYAEATQTVFGEGCERAAVVLVGEQPGDQEDRSGHPFVGPAGHLLDRALEQAGVDRETLFLTNAVKHFKWTPSGNRRLHKTPSARERAACRPWLMAELASLDPTVVVCLGATASASLLGSSFRLSAHRGDVLEGPEGRAVVATIHPSAVLRAGHEERETAFAGLVADLSLAARVAAAASSP